MIGQIIVWDNGADELKKNAIPGRAVPKKRGCFDGMTVSSHYRQIYYACPVAES